MIALARDHSKVIDLPQKQKSNEWFTPSRYIEAAREVMGGIDLDPASCELANETVKATRYYAKEENGLTKEWNGRVWLNPPFSRDGTGKSPIGKWTTKLVEEYQSQRVQSALLLSTCRTDTSWFRLLWQYPICFADHRICFYQSVRGLVTKVMDAASINGTIFVYLGPYEQRFIEVFSQFGRIAKAVDTPRQRVIPLSLWEGIE